MLLIGQFDSPFVRRVGITLRLYEQSFEHRPWSVFRDAEQLATLNPLRRVPTLVLDDGTVLVETFACLEVLDEARALARGTASLLLPRGGPLRRQGLRVLGFATGVADKTVSLIYERILREQRSETWTARCRTQVIETLTLLERELTALEQPFFLGGELGHPDIAVTCALTLIRDGLPGWLDVIRFPRLAELAARCEALPAFAQTYQPFDAPME